MEIKRESLKYVSSLKICDNPVLKSIVTSDGSHSGQVSMISILYL